MSLYKSMGRASLVWNELEEVLLDVEVALNNRKILIDCVEDDILLPVLTPCVMMFCQLVEYSDEGDTDLRKRVKFYGLGGM